MAKIIQTWENMSITTDLTGAKESLDKKYPQAMIQALRINKCNYSLFSAYPTLNNEWSNIWKYFYLEWLNLT